MNAPSGLALLVARASAPSNRSNTPPNTHSRPAGSHSWRDREAGGDDRDAEADQRQAVGGEAEPAEADGDRRHEAADAGPELGRDERAAHEAACPAGARSARLRARACRSANWTNASGTMVWTVSRPWRRAVTRPDLAQLAQVPRHERLRQPDRLDELGDGRRALREDAADPQAVHVRERLVEPPQLAQVVGLDDDVRDRAADAGGGGGHGVGRASDTGTAPLGSTAVYINGR